jgi:putative flavoprotein involved in K+ transport
LPNWQTRLPGYGYQGSNPDGYMSMPEVARYLQHYADLVRAPVTPETLVTRVSQAGSGYHVTTDRGVWRCRTLLIASGACNIAAIPPLAEGLPRGILSLVPSQCRKPMSAAGGGRDDRRRICQRRPACPGDSYLWSRGYSVRRRTCAAAAPLSRARHLMVDGRTRPHGHGLYTEVEDLGRARGVPSPQLIGTTERASIDLNGLRKAGVELVGRLAAVRDGKAQFSGSLANLCALADLKTNRMLASIDSRIAASGDRERFPPPRRFEPTAIPMQSRLALDLKVGDIGR